MYMVLSKCIVLYNFIKRALKVYHSYYLFIFTIYFLNIYYLPIIKDNLIMGK